MAEQDAHTSTASTPRVSPEVASMTFSHADLWQLHAAVCTSLLDYLRREKPGAEHLAVAARFLKDNGHAFAPDEKAAEKLRSLYDRLNEVLAQRMREDRPSNATVDTTRLWLTAHGFTRDAGNKRDAAEILATLSSGDLPFH